MRLLIILVIATLFAGSAPAQKRPPKAVIEKVAVMDTVIFSKPVPKSLTPYSDIKGAYSVVFAGKSVHFEDVQKGTLYTVDRAVKPGASSQSVTVLHLPVALAPELMYGTFRQSLDKPPTSSITSETGTEVDGRKGLFLDARVGSSRQVSKLIVDGRRVFQFTFEIESWQLIEQVPELVADANEEIARFFGSIKIVAEPPDTTPIDVLGEWRDLEYVNDYIGFRWPFDARWTVVDGGEIDNFRKRGAGALRAKDEQTQSTFESAIRTEVIVGGLKIDSPKYKAPAVLLSVKRIGAHFTIWEIAQTSMELFTKMQNYEVVGALTSSRIGGEQCINWELEGRFGVVTVYQSIYLFMRGEYAVTFVVSATNKAELREFSKTVAKVRWNPPKAVKPVSK